MTAPAVSHHAPSAAIGACWMPYCTKPATVYAVYPNGAITRVCGDHEHRLPGHTPARSVARAILAKLRERAA